MSIPTDKPLKKCPLCNKDVRNMGYHIANIHPSALAQLEENIPPPSPPATPTPTLSGKFSPPGVVGGDLNALIREKVETMLNIKIVEMLSKGANVGDVAKVLNPPQPTSFIELKQMHDLIYSAKPHLEEKAEENSGNQWLELINNALPIVKDMLPQRKKQMEENKNVEFGTDEKGSVRILKPIQDQTSGDTDKPGSSSEESGTFGEVTKQNVTGITRIIE